jgi:cell shape-determining protein MreC
MPPATSAPTSSRQTTLLRENEELRRRQLGTANLLLRQEHLEQENKRMRALLDMRTRQPVEGRIAEILYAARDPFRAGWSSTRAASTASPPARPWSMTSA